ncbi:hypothetical protein Kpol_2002p81 [Vanderwaltozyma polyspora DSM 70294]|uniref:Presequence translocated-associated motor subunit PAM17 n=1 Tax=Vanderwaltozyma polyspora (strain ATCC 22028 / DSM 70294 / BCRC 21397 / CBS 2163 / NBRC 10782 / NRRL Y-8283 / UCD 57-17) TaxID=436907 RepID=A7TFJ6_VANPO|nr:uncharacterized protein Kpol_2002p81 [Vanderwaltozyma polyspora DSM 70294]EDO19010.1 hypothetical protein Kpol_2002p81 [Vanderwaltozyma polyspora DSM 70294]
MISVVNRSVCSSTRRCLISSMSYSTVTSSSSSSSSSNDLLTWTEFFQLRKKQRKINVGSSAFTALVGANVSWAYLSTMQIDPTQTILGFDPLVVISAGLIASGTLGYLFGPLLGSQLFQLSNRSKLTAFNNKNKEFLKKIIHNRVDASSQSFSNPVPDYYGEKIGSLKEYRQWLRDCHAYRRKAKEFL